MCIFVHMRNFITVLLCVVSMQLFGQKNLAIVREDGQYPYWISLPHDTIMATNPPVLVFLHGRSLSGTDIERVRKYGVIHEIDKGRNVPAIVIAPQLPNGPWNPSKVDQIVESVIAKYNADRTRLYVAGMSLGGYGTLHYCGTFPDKVAAAVALCGGGNEKDAKNLAKVPLWIQHGDRDRAVPKSESDKIVAAIKRVNGKNVTYTVVKGADHGALERVFRSDEMYNWLFKHVKKEESSSHSISN